MFCPGRRDLAFNELLHVVPIINYEPHYSTKGLRVLFWAVNALQNGDRLVRFPHIVNPKQLNSLCRADQNGR